jgi:hypothetical protein
MQPAEPRDALRAYVDPVTKLDGQFDFPARRHVVECLVMRTMRLADMVAFLDGNEGFYGPQAIMSTFIGNHDLPRIIHLAANSRLWGDNQYADGKDRAWQSPPISAPVERELRIFSLEEHMIREAERASLKDAEQQEAECSRADAVERATAGAAGRAHTNGHV